LLCSLNTPRISPTNWSMNPPQSSIASVGVCGEAVTRVMSEWRCHQTLLTRRRRTSRHGYVPVDPNFKPPVACARQSSPTPRKGVHMRRRAHPPRGKAAEHQPRGARAVLRHSTPCSLQVVHAEGPRAGSSGCIGSVLTLCRRRTAAACAPDHIFVPGQRVPRGFVGTASFQASRRGCCSPPLCSVSTWRPNLYACLDRAALRIVWLLVWVSVSHVRAFPRGGVGTTT
jgi:hypothetical protein